VSSDNHTFPDYGDHGDIAGARRSRKAFRFSILAMVLLTFIMYISEQYLRYNHTESLYIHAITLPKDSARVFLLQAIKIDKEQNEQQTAKYSQALAVRQESDKILESYEEALKIDPENTLFILRYGCRLYMEGQYAEALNQFKLVDLLLEGSTPNALPGYLQAACLVEIDRSTAGYNRAMATISRINKRNHELAYPKPFWFTEYPKTGEIYAEHNRTIIKEMIAPLEYLSNRIFNFLTLEIENGHTDDSRIWLEQMMKMGENLAFQSSPTGTLQAILGIENQIHAFTLLEKLESETLGANVEPTIEKRLRLQQALELLTAFEAERSDKLTEEKNVILLPLLITSGSILILSILWFGLFFLYKLFGLKKSAWTIPHTTMGKTMLLGGNFFLLVLLYLMTLLQHISNKSIELIQFSVVAWSVTLGIMVLFGFIYPAITLTPPEEVARRTGRPEEIDTTHRFAKSRYRKVYASLAMRYYGILNGLAILTVCIWIITYRLDMGLYPWQINLLADGFLSEEIQLIDDIKILLSQSSAPGNG